MSEAAVEAADSTELSALMSAELGEAISKPLSQQEQTSQGAVSGLFPVVTIAAGKTRAARFQPNEKDDAERLPLSLVPRNYSDSQLQYMRAGSLRRGSSLVGISHCSTGSTCSHLSVWRDDLCQLCASDPASLHERLQQQHLLLLDEPPAATKQLPCSCPDRRLHVACLEARYLNEASRPDGCSGCSRKRRLRIRCKACGEVFAMTRQRRGRRLYDLAAKKSFARHLAAVLPLAGALVGFGVWSMLHPAGGRVTFLNAALVGGGALILLLFAAYELWRLYRRFDFVFARAGPGRSGGGDGQPLVQEV